MFYQALSALIKIRQNKLEKCHFNQVTKTLENQTQMIKFTVRTLFLRLMAERLKNGTFATGMNSRIGQKKKILRI